MPASILLESFMQTSNCVAVAIVVSNGIVLNNDQFRPNFADLYNLFVCRTYKPPLF